MRAVALGAAGDMGRTAVRTAAALGGLDELVLADLDEGAAEQLARRLQQEDVSTPVRVVRADVTDGDALRNLLRGADAVLNTVGPFYRFAVPVLEAAIECECHYLDICDDWEPTLEMLTLDERARRAGITAVLGLGASPGVSNLLAVLARRELDVVDDLYTAWPLAAGALDGGEDEAGAGTARPSAALVHWMQQISGTVRVLERGAFVDRRPLEGVRIAYPGLGSGTAYSVGHPEPVTLARNGAVRRNAACVMVGPPPIIGFLQVLREELDARRLTNEAAASLVAEALEHLAASRDADLRDAGFPTGEGLEGPGGLPPFFAYARGTKNGRPRAAGARVLGLPRGMAGATGIPLALGLAQLREGAIREPGVHAPEDVVDAASFFDALAPHCEPPLPDRSALVAVTTA